LGEEDLEEEDLEEVDNVERNMEEEEVDKLEREEVDLEEEEVDKLEREEDNLGAEAPAASSSALIMLLSFLLLPFLLNIDDKGEVVDNSFYKIPQYLICLNVFRVPNGVAHGAQVNVLHVDVIITQIDDFARLRRI